ncbi:MAG: TIGR01777 family oxidoreductase [Chloroflexota bacterium]
MNILILGGTGLIGSALTNSVLSDGHKVWVLTRNPDKKLAEGVNTIPWNDAISGHWQAKFDTMDAIVNLAGETVGHWPWNAERKTNILQSRLKAGQIVSQAFKNTKTKPAVLVQSSAIGFYGPLGTQPVGEDGKAGQDFMANVTKEWEASTSSIEQIPGVRRVVIRTSLVLDARQGVLPLMALPVRLFAGGPLGNGKQGVSWIHIEDEVRAIRFLMENDKAGGIFNLSSPHPVSNSLFIRELAHCLGRPYWIPAPAFALKLALGEMSTLLLDGQYVLPTRLIEAGFHFNYEHASEAFESLF